jgi:prepilin-type N-terminal cleavage/methylation domain-containing protein
MNSTRYSAQPAKPQESRTVDPSAMAGCASATVAKMNIYEVDRYYTNQSTDRIRGFSLIELLMVLLIGTVLTVMAIPASRTAIATYRLDAAVNSVTGAIQSTRYQAIMHGYPFQIDIDGTANTFQVSSEPGGTTTFTATGTAIPLSGSAVTINVGTTNSTSTGHVILQFKPNGSILATSGQSMPMSFTVSYNGTTKTLTVSNYGAISVQ